MSAKARTVAVVPCSGIGKPAGSVSREAAYELCEELRPETTVLVALSRLVVGEPEAAERVRHAPVITIDGCKLRCAAKLVAHVGGTVTREVAVLDAYKRHKDLKPEGIAELNESGQRLARLIADEAVTTIDELSAAGEQPGDGHA